MDIFDIMIFDWLDVVSTGNGTPHTGNEVHFLGKTADVGVDLKRWLVVVLDSVHSLFIIE